MSSPSGDTIANAWAAVDHLGHPANDLAPRIGNLAEWRAHLPARLRQQVEVSADPALVSLVFVTRDKELSPMWTPAGIALPNCSSLRPPQGRSTNTGRSTNGSTVTRQP